VSVSVEIVFAAAVEASVCVDAVGVQATPAVVDRTFVDICTVHNH